MRIKQLDTCVECGLPFTGDDERFAFLIGSNGGTCNQCVLTCVLEMKRRAGPDDVYDPEADKEPWPDSCGIC